MYVTIFGYKSPPIVAMNTDYAFIRLVRLISSDFDRQTPAVPKLVQVSKADLVMTTEMKIYHIGCM